MTDLWLLVEVEGADGLAEAHPLCQQKWRFMVSQFLKVIPEERTVEQSVAAASEMGFDVARSSGVSVQRMDEVKLAVIRKLRDTLHLNVRSQDVEVEVLARIWRR